MDEHLDESYFHWLYTLIGSSSRVPSRTHYALGRQLFRQEFVPHIPRDENRVNDGRDLRYEFVNEKMATREIEKVNASWMGMGCSFLEMLIALSRVFAFETETTTRGCFWHMMDNLNVSQFNDRYHAFGEGDIADAMERVINRTYAPDGSGGLFPLQNPKEDQRHVEIWYQLNAYLIERDEY